MSKQQGDYRYIIPGEKSWEIWTSSTNLIRDKITDSLDLHDITLSSGIKNILFFPISTLTFSPFRVETVDKDLFHDLIDTHWETLGLKPSTEDGVLQDFSIIDQDETTTILAPFVLEQQKENDLPKGSVNYFDISPHLYHIKEDKIIIRKELGHWTLTYYLNGSVFYALQLGRDLDDQALLDARLVILQLSMQGCCPSKVDVEIWVPVDEPSKDYSKIQLGGSLKTITPPEPTIPKSFSKLLPADVGAERRRLSQKKRMTTLLTLGAIVYLAGLGYVGYQLYGLNNEVKVLRVENQALNEPIALLDAVQMKWDQYKTTVDSNSWPDEILWKCYNALPDKKAIRLLNFEVKSDEATALPAFISIKGNAPTPDLITKFSQQLKNPQFKLDQYEWNTPNPTPPAKDKPVWTFSYDASLKDLLPPQ